MTSISVAFWYQNKISPVVFMVDDLANIYFNKHGRYNEGDWGGLLHSNNSMYCYLKNTFIKNTPKLKFTFFLVAGEREIQSIGQYDFVSSCKSDVFGGFLDGLSNDGHEIAYHGNKHGVIDDTGRFIQEWSSFKSIHEANSSIQQGLEYISSSSTVNITGGKYCGYEAGNYGHSSIVSNKFRWWFDLWDSDINKRPYGEFIDGILYLPSNVDCSIYSASLVNYCNKKKYYSSLIRQLQSRSIEATLERLLEMNAIISLQEHTSPVRTDGKTQYPNIFDDYESILYILNKLNEFDVWWATASQVANYTRNRNYIKIRMTSISDFILSCDNLADCCEGVPLSLFVSEDIKSIVFNNETYKAYKKDDRFLIDVPVFFDSTYQLRNEN